MEFHYQNGIAWKTDLKTTQPACFGHLNRDCSGCKWYLQCLDRTNRVIIATAERDFDVPKE
jgi:hypothetical protein